MQNLKRYLLKTKSPKEVEKLLEAKDEKSDEKAKATPSLKALQVKPTKKKSPMTSTEELKNYLGI